MFFFYNYRLLHTQTQPIIFIIGLLNLVNLLTLRKLIYLNIGQEYQKITLFVLSTLVKNPMIIKLALHQLLLILQSLLLLNVIHLIFVSKPEITKIFVLSFNLSLVPKSTTFFIFAPVVDPQVMAQFHALELHKTNPSSPFYFSTWFQIFHFSKLYSCHLSTLNSFNSGFHIGIPFI